MFMLVRDAAVRVEKKVVLNFGRSMRSPEPAAAVKEIFRVLDVFS